ncbi:hypothetical protein ACIRO1_34275 [Streptomyces sp. NPDC102381]|uniref:hypothetical protein n=1 Tax=Streptomyces sp. NPDC102381 TaxID=3366164 RepID=UPI003808FE5D
MLNSELREELVRCAVAGFLALSQQHFGFRALQGRRAVPLDQAHVFAARRPDLWGAWSTLPPEEHHLIGRLWRAVGSEGDLAQREEFFEACRTYAVSSLSLFRLPEEADPDAATWLVACHDRDPAELFADLVEEIEGYRDQLQAPLATAGEGRWSFGRDPVYTVEIPASERRTAGAAVQLTTQPYLEAAELPRKLVLEHVGCQAAAEPGKFGWKPGLLERFFDRLTDAFGREVGAVRMPAGPMTVLNAPTGVGKSVLMRDAAHLLAAHGQGPVLIVVGQIRDALSTAEQIAADDELVRQTAAMLRDAAARERSGLDVAAWVAASRHDDQAALAFAQDRMDRFEAFAHGCEMTGWQVDGPALDRSRLPCTRLRFVDGPRPPVNESAPHLCPRLAVCERFDHVRRAARADIIVTNHHNLIRGRCHIPVEVDNERVVNDMSALEFVLRRCRVVIVDEVDAFQSRWCTTGAQQFNLASRGRGATGRLEEIDRHLSGLSALDNLLTTHPLAQARRLSQSFLDNVLTGHLELDAEQARQNRPGSGWYLVGRNDADLCRALTNAGPDAEVTKEMHEALRALFPAEHNRNALPDGWEPLAAQIRYALSGKVPGSCKARKLPVFKHALSRVLAQAPFQVPEAKRAGVVNDLLVRAWLGALENELHTLKLAVLPLMGQVQAAADLAATLGQLGRDDPIPYGALGQNLYGFKVDRTADGTRGSLSLQSLSRDPHTSTVRLGDTVALATAGVRRSVLGLSATSFFPKAAQQHVHRLPAYVMTDATAPGAVTARAGHVSATREGWNPISIGGIEERRKPDELRFLAEQLWHTHLRAHLEHLARNDPQRERALLVGNSYFHAAVMAAGIAAACGHPEWVAVLVRPNSPTSSVPLPDGVVRITLDELEDLPRTHPRVKVICAVLPLVSRGLNILIPGTDQSAIASVWVGVRPITHLHEPSVMYASINAFGLSAGVSGPDPGGMLASERRSALYQRNLLLRTDPRFSRMPKTLKAEVLAGILVELIQLAGRARRGGTPVELYLVDHAFFNQELGCDFPRLLRFYYNQLDAEEQELLKRTYGSTLTAWLDLAHGELLPGPVTIVPAPAPTTREEDLPCPTT